MCRAQTSMPVVEAVVGAVVILAVAGGFVVAGDGEGRAARTAQLDREAADALWLLAEEPFGNRTLAGTLASEAAFEGNRSVLGARLDALVSDGAFFRLTTPYGAVGQPRVDGVPTGHATRTTRRGTVRLRVWYG